MVSLYSADANSAAAAGALQETSEGLLLTALAELETVNSMGLRVFRKEISHAQAEASQRAFEEDLRSGVFIRRAVTAAAFDGACRLSRKTTARMGTRSADLLHVAAAIELGAASFFSFDLRQRDVAQDAGLTLNPMP